MARGRAVLIGGEAGVGKSRLLGTALEQARSTALVLSGGCIGISEGALPFAPIIEAVRPLGRFVTPLANVDPTASPGPPGSHAGKGAPTQPPVSGEELRGISSRLGALADAGQSAAAELRPEWARSHVYEAFLDTLRRLADARPVVLVIEDLHWADSSTRELLAYVIRNTQQERVLVLATYRSDELHRRHPLLPWIVEVDRLPNVERIELERLGLEDVAQQLAGILGRPPQPGLVDRIFARSEGNPFFVEELIAAGVESAHLPATLREVLAGRLSGLSDETIRLVGVAAIIGRRVEHDLLATVTDLSDEVLDQALQEAVTSQILVTDPDAAVALFTFRHALLAEAAAETVLPGRRRRLHAEIAAALVARAALHAGEGAGPLAEVAHHWFEARELDRAFVGSSAAAEAAFRAGAYAEALQQYQRVVELWDVVNDPTGTLGFDRIELLRRTAQAAQLAGEYPRALELLGEAVRRSEAAGDRVRTGLLLERVGRSQWTAGAFGEALSTYRRAVDLVPDQPPTAERVRVVAGFAQMLMLSGRFADAHALAEPALEVARAIGARQVEGHLLATLGAGMGYAGDADRGVELIRTALAIAEETGDLDDLGRAYAALSSTLEFAGRREEGAAVALAGADRMKRLGMGATYGAFLRMNAADDLVALGRWDEALGHMRDVEARARGTSQMLVQQELAQLLALRGDVVGAQAALDALASYVGHDVEAQFTGPVSATRIALATLTGDVASGRAVADRILPILAQTDDLPRRIVVVAAALQLEAGAAERARAARDATAATDALRRADGYLATLRGLATGSSTPSQRRMVERAVAVAEAEHGRAMGHSDPESWRRAILVGSSDAPVHEIAYDQFRLAEALLADRTERDEAGAILERAHATAMALGAQPLGHWIEALAARARLALGRPAPVEAPTGPASASADAASSLPAGSGPRPGGGQRVEPQAQSALAAYGLTARETDVLRLLTLGRSNRQIGQELFISESTAGVHVSRVLGKLGVSNRVEAATIAARLGLAD
jgi:DNA-binding CsgD family transcriptional regulator